MADRPNFAEALRQRNLQNPTGVAETSLNPVSGGYRTAAGLSFEQESRPNFALALEQGMPAEGVMADTPPQFFDEGALSLGQAFRTGLNRGVDSTQMIGGGILRWFGREFGSDALETYGNDIADKNIEEIQGGIEFVDSLSKIESFDDFLEWAAAGVGTAIPSLAIAGKGGLVGGTIARAVVKRKIANEMTGRILGDMAAKGFARDAAKAATARTLRNPATARIIRDAVKYGNAVDLRRGMARGAALGTFIPSAGMMTGEAELAGVPGGKALAVGVTGGLLETAVLARAVRMMFPGVDRKVSNNFIKDFAKATGSQAVLEGSQEGAQELIQQAALAFHDPSFDMLDPENALQVADSFAIGALVGTIMGAGASVVGQTTTAARSGIRGSAEPDGSGGGMGPFVTPPLGPPGRPNNGLPADFEPADNTLTEEITGRLNDIMGAHVTPAMNTLQEKVAAITEKIRRNLPGAMSGVGVVTEPIQQLNNEFIEGSLPIVEEIRRYAGEQVAYIVEAAQEIPEGPMRQQFIEEEIAAAEEEIASVAEDLAERGEQVSQTAENRVLQMQMGDIFDNDMFVAAGADPEFTFGMNERLVTRQGIPYQRPTRGERSVPFPKRSQAETWMKRLRKAYPSANEDSFQIIENPAGEGFLITLADQLQRDELLEDEVVTFGLQNARTSARGHQVEARKVRLENKTTIDVPTLAFQGRRLDRGEQQSMSEAFAAMTGRLLDRGEITDQDFANLTKAFENHFTTDERAANVRTIQERHAAIERGDFQPKGTTRADGTIEGPRGERSSETARDFDSLPPRLKKLINERVDGQLTDEAREDGGVNIRYENAQLVLEASADPTLDVKRPLTKAEMIEMHENGRVIYGLSLRDNTLTYKTRRGKPFRNPGRIIRREELVAEELADLSDAEIEQEEQRDEPPKPPPGLDTTETQAQRSRDTRNPKERDIPQMPVTEAKPRTRTRKKGAKKPASTRDIVRAKQRERLEREEQRDKEAKAKRKPRKRKKPTMRTPHKKVATRKPGKSAKSRATVWIPQKAGPLGLTTKQKKNQARAEEAISELVEKVLTLIPERQTELRVINREAARRMIESNHPDADIVGHLEDVEVAAIMPSFDGRPVYIMVPETAVLQGLGLPDTAVQGYIPVGLIHELGHYIHYETWESLSREGQDKLIDAFRKDVATGKFRPTDPGERMLSVFTGNPMRPMQDNLFEFREWMADQMVDWMMSRRQPKNAVERFLEKVAVRLQALYDFIAEDSGRRGMLNETYADFVDTMAKRVRQPGYGNDFWFKEGSNARSREILKGAPHQPVQIGLSPQQAARVRRSLEEYPKIATSANKMIEWMSNAYRVALAPSTSHMRNLSKKGIRAADTLVRMFNRQPHGQSKIGNEQQQNYHQAREQMQGVFITRMKKILQGMSEGDLFRLGQELRAMDGNPNMVPTTEQGRRVRKLLDEMHEYAKDAGLPVGKIDNYYPRMFNREKLIQDEEAVIAHLKQSYEGQMSVRERQENPNAAEDRARKTFSSLTSHDADSAAALRELSRDPLATQAPAGGFMRSRTATDKFFDRYYNNNVESVLANYVNTVTKRAEYNRRLGEPATENQVGGDKIPRSQWDPRKKLKQLLRQARQEGATEKDLQYMKKYVEANLGMYGRDDIPDGARKVLASVVAYQNMRTLLFSVFASLPDAMGPAIRSGDMRKSFKALFNNISELRDNNSNLSDMARTWGVISDSFNHHVLTEYVDNHYMPKGIRRMNDLFFKYTGLNWWTDFTRKAALAVGIDSIKNEALKAQTAPDQRTRDRAAQFLGELGVTVSQVNSWVARSEQVWGAETYTETNEDNVAADRAVSAALVQFVDESILRPNPSQRPLLASHPAMMLFYHLKGFMYAIHDTILKRLAHNFNVAKTPAQIAAVFIPAVGMMLLTAIGLELRELIAGTRRTDRMDGWEYTWEVFERTGLPGLTQYAWDWDAASARGQSELAGLGGPAMGQVGDLLSKPTSQTIPKGIPIVSQLPWARDFLRDATPL